MWPTFFIHGLARAPTGTCLFAVEKEETEYRINGQYGADAELKFNVEANAVYRVWLDVTINYPIDSPTTGATLTWKLAHSGDTDSLMHRSISSQGFAVSSGGAAVSYARFRTLAQNGYLGVALNSPQRPASIFAEGMVKIGDTPGTLAFWWGENEADSGVGDGAEVVAGSRIYYQKVSA
jgi:hypothetical protein